MSEQTRSTYPGGFPAILKQMEGRRDPLQYGAGEALVPLDVDLAPLKHRLMELGAPELGDSTSTYARKYKELAKEFAGQPALLHLHGLLVAHLRRRAQPAHAAALFVRLWAEEADFLMAHLDARWLVSAATTFGDHGQSETQRSLGHALSVLFGMMKLYETERLFSGSKPEQPFAWGRRSSKTLAMQMDAYSIAGAGGLDVNMLGRLWQEGSEDPVIAPLVQRLLSLLIEDDRTVFRRIQTMRSRRQKQIAEEGAPPGGKRKRNIVPVPQSRIVTDAGALTWGTVSLVKAPLDRILEFAAYHLDLGAHEVHLYLDEPEPDTLDALQRHPRIRVTACDGAYWDAQKKPRMKTHRMRQVWVATQAYNNNSCHWLAHVDVDEFLLPQEGRSVADLLAEVPADKIALRLDPAEQLDTGGQDEMFKLSHRTAGQRRAVAEEIFPTFGAHLPSGFISHTEGKNIVRTGVDGLRFGIHALHFQGAPVTNVQDSPRFYLGHAHAPDWNRFRKNLEFRLTRGSYRRDEVEGPFKFGDLVDYLLDKEGADALRNLYAELNEATPALQGALRKYNMLLEHPLHLQDRVARVFDPILKGRP